MLNETEFLLIGQQLMRLHEKVMGEISRKYGMSRNEVEILLFLTCAPQCDTAKEIVEGRMLTKSCVSKAIDSLVKQGMLITREEPSDRRVLHLEVQEKAAEVISAGLKAQQEMVEFVFLGTSEEEKEFLQAIHKKLLKNIREAMRSCGKN